MVVNRINECEVRNAREWTKCLEVLHERQKFHQANTGYLVQYSKVLPMTASSGRVISNTASGEVQCCSGRACEFMHSYRSLIVDP